VVVHISGYNRAVVVKVIHSLIGLLMPIWFCKIIEHAHLPRPTTMLCEVLRIGCAGRSPCIWYTTSTGAALAQMNLVLLHCFDELIWLKCCKEDLASSAMRTRRPFKARTSVHRHHSGAAKAAAQCLKLALHLLMRVSPGGAAKVQQKIDSY
jgi:hypothetical protein